MFKKTLFSLILIASINLGFSQSNLNKYKYVIVPNKFDFLKQVDQYQLNSLTQFLFNKYGFTAIMENDDFPPDLSNNRCLALNSTVRSESGLFKTKLIVELKNCKNEVAFTSKIGESREKQYEKAYNLALRDAFESFDALNYHYQPDEDLVTAANEANASMQGEVEKPKSEIKALKEAKVTTVEKVETSPKPVDKPKIESPPLPTSPPTPVVKTESSNLLYAQVIDNGFQLVDSSPKVVYKIKNTGLNNVFLVEGKNAILYKSGEAWILEYYENDTLKREQLPIKF